MPCVCPGCLGRSTSPAFTKDGHDYVACRHCGHAWLHPMPGPEALLRLYESSYFEGGLPGGYADYERDAGLHEANARRRLALIARTLGVTRGRLLDVGCATGFLLRAALEAGFVSEGVEPSGWARERAAQRTQVNIYSDLGDALRRGAQQHDVVCFFQALEHMPDPERALQHARACLGPSGALVIETWNRDSFIARALGAHWQQVSPPSVLHLMTIRSLRRLLARSGFGDMHVHPTSKLVSVGFVASLLKDKYPRLATPFFALARHPTLRDRPIRYGLGDLVTVTARRAPAAMPSHR